MSPFGKIDGLYFNNSREPDDFLYEFRKDVQKILKEEDVEYLEIKVENKEDYYKLLDKLANFNKDCIVVSGTSRDNYTLILENQEETDSDSDDSDESDDNENMEDSDGNDE